MNSDDIPDVLNEVEKPHHHEEENINIRAAVVHVIGDML
jgi:Co/Zn/Cd efflux system component